MLKNKKIWKKQFFWTQDYSSIPKKVKSLNLIFYYEKLRYKKINQKRLGYRKFLDHLITVLTLFGIFLLLHLLIRKIFWILDWSLDNRKTKYKLICSSSLGPCLLKIQFLGMYLLVSKSKKSWCWYANIRSCVNSQSYSIP